MEEIKEGTRVKHKGDEYEIVDTFGRMGLVHLISDDGKLIFRNRKQVRRMIRASQ